MTSPNPDIKRLKAELARTRSPRERQRILRELDTARGLPTPKPRPLLYPRYRYRYLSPIPLRERYHW